MIKLLQWNIWYLENIDKIIRVLKDIDADIICIQELSGNCIANPGRRTDIVIAEELNMFYHCVHAQEWQNWNKEYQGNGIFSKYPLFSKKATFLRQPHEPNTIDYSAEGRVYLEASLKIDHKSLTIGTTHLSYTHNFNGSKERDIENNELLRVLNHESQFIFCGDLNTPPSSSLINTLFGRFKFCGPDLIENTWTTKPFSYNGFDENELRWRLDYVFSTDDLKISNSEIILTDASDHLPTLVCFDL